MIVPTASPDLRPLRILFIEDDDRLQRIVRRVFEHERWRVTVASDGRAGLQAARANEFDCLVVDRLLPELDGLSLIRVLRAEGNFTPLLMLTARGERPERIEGLDAGADDYLGKPFAFEELLARIRALVRRAAAPSDPGALPFGDLILDLKAHAVVRGDERVELTMREFAVLKALAIASGRVLSRNELLAAAWNDEPDLHETVVDVYIHYLRRKLDPPHARGSESVIRTVRGAGYALRAN
jgi:DNA-binding response OmpR family regulator